MYKLFTLYRNLLYQTSRHHPVRLSIYFLHQFSVTNNIHACNLLVFASTTPQNFYTRINHLRVVLNKMNMIFSTCNLSTSYRNPLHQTPTSPSTKTIYLFCSKKIRPSIYFLHWFSVTNSIHACNLLAFASTTLQNFYTEDQWFKSRSQQNEHVFIYNVFSKRILSYNHLRISTFKFQLKILFRKSPQQRVGYHLVMYRFMYMCFAIFSKGSSKFFSLQI